MDTVCDMKIAKKVSKLLLDIKAVTINTKKPYRFTSGILSPMYTDNRLVMSFPKVRATIIDYYVWAIKEKIGLKKVEVLSGTATAAIPHTAFIASKLNLPMVYVRSSKKEHGKENQVEGIFKKDSKILIIEDLISTGKSSNQNAGAIRELGGVVTGCLATTTSTKNAFVQTFQDMKVPLFTLTNALVTVATAAEEGYITEKEKKMVEAFFEDAKNWGKNMGFE